MTGPGGSGKSHVIESVLSYARSFCLGIGTPFDRRTIVVTATTGVAAIGIHGETLYSALHFGASEISNDKISQWKNARLIFVDEISFASPQQLKNLSENLCKLMQVDITIPYAGKDVVFGGDFCQLEPVNSYDALYKRREFTLWHDMINCFIELYGLHRFKGDMEWGELLMRFRKGCPTKKDFQKINKHVVQTNQHGDPVQPLPTNIQYAVCANKERSAINDAVFLKHLQNTHSKDRSAPVPKHTILIKADEMKWSKTNKEVGKATQHATHSSCPDHSVKTTGFMGHFVDPLLKLHQGIPLMSTENEDVTNGQANGTLSTLESVHLKSGVQMKDLEIVSFEGYHVRMARASQIDHLLCRFDCGDKFIGTFKVSPKKALCDVTMTTDFLPGVDQKIKAKINMNQLHLLVNHATTGHKLQGRSLDCVFVSSWGSFKNWAYVVLSRVRTEKGLFLRKPLDPSKNYSLDGRLTRMLHELNKLKPVNVDCEDIL